jgi:hypothetical protein
MKKPLAIVISICIAIFLYLYFRGPDKTDALKKSNETESLLKETAPGLKNYESDDYRSEERGRDYGTEYKSNPDFKNLRENTVSFAILSRGDYKVYSFKAVKNFVKIAASPELSGYTASFVEDIKNLNVSDQSTYHNLISMMLPSEVVPGSFNEGSSNFLFQYFGTNKGTLYSLDQSCPFELNIIEWGGTGGRARGVFSGKLFSIEATEPIYIQDGKFDVGIQ